MLQRDNRIQVVIELTKVRSSDKPSVCDWRDDEADSGLHIGIAQNVRKRDRGKAQDSQVVGLNGQA